MEADRDNKKEKDNTLLSVGLLSMNEMLAVESSRKTFMSIMIGDFVCNYADGIVIGVRSAIAPLLWAGPSPSSPSCTSCLKSLLMPLFS